MARGPRSTGSPPCRRRLSTSPPMAGRSSGATASFSPPAPGAAPSAVAALPPACCSTGSAVCPRCLDPGHPRVDCRKDVRCKRCRFFGHIARNCSLPRPASPDGAPAPAAKRPRISSPRPPRSSSASVEGPCRPESSGPASPSCSGPLQLVSEPSALAASSGLPASLPASSGLPGSSPGLSGLLGSSASRSASSSAAVPLSGHPSLRPSGAVCYLPRSGEIAAAEMTLRKALVATVVGNRSRVSCDEVTVLLRRQFDLSASAFSIHPRHPEGFLIRFADRETRARVAAARVSSRRFRLLLHPWSSIADGEPVCVVFRVDIEIVGIPEHGWHRSSAEILLSPFCLIEHLAPKTRDGRDMSVFRLSAWTANPDAIPRDSELLLPEPGALAPDDDPDRVSAFAVSLIRFPVSIHVARTEDYRLPAIPPPPPPCSPDGDDGSAPGSPPLPPSWPQKHVFPSRGNGAGRSDRHHAGGGSGGQRRRRASPPFRG
ncbi:hypothetical protein ACQJBY_028118 [Aegilops geniculata]